MSTGRRHGSLPGGVRGEYNQRVCDASREGDIVDRQALMDRLLAENFEPFEMQLADGRSFDIVYREQVRLLPDMVLVLDRKESHGRHEFSDSYLVEYPDIRDLRRLTASASSNQGNPGA